MWVVHRIGAGLFVLVIALDVLKISLILAQDAGSAPAASSVFPTFWHSEYNPKPYQKISITLLVSICVYFKGERIDGYNLF